MFTFGAFIKSCVHRNVRLLVWTLIGCLIYMWPIRRHRPKCVCVCVFMCVCLCNCMCVCVCVCMCMRACALYTVSTYLRILWRTVASFIAHLPAKMLLTILYTQSRVPQLKTEIIQIILTQSK